MHSKLLIESTPVRRCIVKPVKCRGRCSAVAVACQNTRRAARTTSPTLAAREDNKFSLRSVLSAIAGSAPVLLAAPAGAMQELATEMSEMDLGLEPMPDASLLTLATLIYCSLAFVGVFLRQQDEDTDETKTRSGADGGSSTTTSNSSSPLASNTSSSMPSSQEGSTASPSLAASQQYCQQLSRDSRLRILCSSTASHVTASVRDSRYLLERMMPDRLHAACEGASAAPRVEAAPVLPALLAQSMGRGAAELQLRNWLASLVDSYVDAKQSASGMSRETAARVVLNNQDATLRHLCTHVAQESALLGVVHLMTTLQADPAFNPSTPAAADPATGGNVAAH